MIHKKSTVNFHIIPMLLLSVKIDFPVKVDVQVIKCLCVVQALSSDLKHSPEFLDDLKFVLSAIARIRAMSLDVEMTCRNIVEEYRTLAMYGITVPEGETELVGSIEQRWRDVFHEAKMLDRSLVAVKKKFTRVSIHPVIEGLTLAHGLTCTMRWLADY